MPRILWLAPEIAFAPFPDNDIPKAEAYMQRFYQFHQEGLSRRVSM